MLYLATHYRRNERGETRKFGTERAAEQWARSILQPVVTTNDCYWRDMGRADDVRLSRSFRCDNQFSGNGEYSRVLTVEYLRTIEPEAVIVPSVGELGWTP